MALVSPGWLMRTGAPDSSPDTPVAIDTVGLACANGVCDLGTGNVGTFLNLSLSATGGSGPRHSSGKWSAANSPPS